MYGGLPSFWFQCRSCGYVKTSWYRNPYDDMPHEISEEQQKEILASGKSDGNPCPGCGKKFTMVKGNEVLTRKDCYNANFVDESFHLNHCASAIKFAPFSIELAIRSLSYTNGESFLFMSEQQQNDVFMYVIRKWPHILSQCKDFSWHIWQIEEAVEYNSSVIQFIEEYDQRALEVIKKALAINGNNLQHVPYDVQTKELIWVALNQLKRKEPRGWDSRKYDSPIMKYVSLDQYDDEMGLFAVQHISLRCSEFILKPSQEIKDWLSKVGDKYKWDRH